MSYADEGYEQQFVVAEQSEATRVAFLKKVYGHVFGCIVALAAIIGGMHATGLDMAMLRLVGGFGAYGPLVYVGGFMLVSWIAHRMAYSQASVGTQYMGMALYVVAEAIVISPLIAYATWLNNADLIGQAGVLTLMIFGGLTAVVFMTKADFSFLKGIVVVGSFAMLGVILLSFIPGLGINTGVWFSAAVIALMAITILWETSEIYHRFPEQAYVAAALALFSSVATLFFYILRLLIALNDD